MLGDDERVRNSSPQMGIEFRSPNSHSYALLITTFYKFGSKACRSELFCSWKSILLSENNHLFQTKKKLLLLVYFL